MTEIDNGILSDLLLTHVACMASSSTRLSAHIGDSPVVSVSLADQHFGN